MKTSEGRKDNIENLTEALEELRLAQIKINQILEKITKEENQKPTGKAKMSTSIQKENSTDRVKKKAKTTTLYQEQCSE